MINRLVNILVLSGLLLGTHDLSSGADFPTFSADQREKLSSGEVVFTEPESPYLFEAAIQIDASAPMVWGLMLDHERVPEYVKGLKESRVLEAGDHWKVIEHRLKLHPLLPRFYYVFREEYSSDYSIDFQNVRGSFKELKGWWKIIPTDNEQQVILMYSTFVAVRFVPKSWINRGIRERVPELLMTFRDIVEGEFESSGAKERSQ